MPWQSLIFFSLTINFVFALGVYFKNKKNIQNKLYATFVFFLNFWIISNFLENEPTYIGYDNVEIFLRLDFVSALVCLYFWLRLSVIFLKKQVQKKKIFKFFNTFLGTGVVIVSLLALFTDTIIYNVRFASGIITFNDGQLWVIYAFLMMTLVIFGITNFLIGRSQEKSTSVRRRQIEFILLGFFISIGNAIIINLFLQTFYPISLEVSRLGLYGMTFLVVMTGYAILKHGLFNLKLVTTEVLVLLMGLLLLLPIFNFNRFKFEHTAYILDIFIFLFFGIFGHYLVQAVRKEIDQREEIASIAASLEKANLQLKHLDMQKTEFLSIASHQLRTPLSILKGYIELISEGAYGKITKKTEKTLKKMDESNERLVVLVDKFLNITRIEQGRTRYRLRPTKLPDIVDDVLKELEPKAKEHNLTIHWKPRRVKEILLDEEKIRHVVFNYIDNAIKYTPEGEITIDVKRKDNGYVCTVKDTGFGFTKEEAAGFFQKFYRAESVRDTNVNGTGLGIFVCKKFIEGHGGKVWAQSDGLKQGSTFGFWIPDKGEKKHKKKI